VTNLLIFAAPLALGLVLLLVGGKRAWAPSLTVSIITGIALRVIVMLTAAYLSVRPYDFSADFPVAANNVLNHHDPVLHAREGGWHFLPLTAYVLAGQLKLGQALGLDWAIAGRLVPIVADLALMLLVGRLASQRQALRRFQWACNPLAIMVCAIHGQIEPLAMMLGVGALVLARSTDRHRAIWAGVLVGLSITSNSWPVLLVPGVLLALPGLRARLTGLCWAVAVPAVFFVTTPFIMGLNAGRELPAVARALMKTRPVVGDWGWTSLFTGGQQSVNPTLGHIGTFVLVAGILFALWWWRRADPVTLTAVILLTFLVVTHRLGAQYLMWPLPYLLVRPTRGTPYALTAASLWAGIGYLWVGTTATWNVTWMSHEVWALTSLAVIPVLVWAMPWRRRVAAPEPGDPRIETEERPPPSRSVDTR